jgi:hypothetical protein
MFNLTNVGLSMCVKVYSDLFLNLMIEYESILAFTSLQGNYLAWREKVCDSIRMAGKVWHNTYPAWWEKVVMTHVLLVYPAQGEKFRVTLMLS